MSKNKPVMEWHRKAAADIFREMFVGKAHMGVTMDRLAQIIANAEPEQKETVGGGAILSGRDIAQYIQSGRLGISPVEPSQVQQNGIDLVLTEVDSWGTPPHFTLGCTAEVLTLPDDLMGFVQLRSTWARHGILITPTIVDCGFSANLTVELYNVGYRGPAPIGERFLHLVFATMLSPGDPYRGKYQGQTGITPAKEDVKR